MQRDVIYLYRCLRRKRFVALFAGIFIGIFILTSCAGLSSDPGSRVSVPGVKSADDDNVAKDSHGPTMMMSYRKYDIKPKNGEYHYENRSDEVFARVNTLAFTRTEQTPRMGIKVASISKDEKPEGFWSHVKGAIANLLITPPKVDKFGNETMLDFGDALLKQKSAFTFPMAKNIKTNKTVYIDPIQKQVAANTVLF